MGKRLEAVTLSVFLCAAFLMPPFVFGSRAKARAENVEQAEVKAMFLSVGKADAALLCLGDKRYLVDTGTKESSEAMLRALSFFGVTRLDGVIVTHTDSDHVGGLKALLKSGIAVDCLYASAFYTVKSVDRHPVAKLAERYHLPLSWLSGGDVIDAGNGMRMAALGPLTRDAANENNNSLVLLLDTPQGTMLLTGDMEVQEEAALIAAGLVQRADVLKVGHHGEDDASSEALIYTVKPQIAVISTDTQEAPNTPDPKVMGRLWNIGAEVFVTQKATCCVQVTLKAGSAVGQLIQYQVG